MKDPELDKAWADTSPADLRLLSEGGVKQLTYEQLLAISPDGTITPEVLAALVKQPVIFPKENNNAKSEG